MFPESHAFAFGVTAYQASWLKCYYPLEFFVAIFNQQPMGFYNLETLKEDARRHGIAVLNPDINLSRDKCVIAEEPASMRTSCSALSPDRVGQSSLPVRSIAGTEARATQYYEFPAFDLEQLCLSSTVSGKPGSRRGLLIRTGGAVVAAGPCNRGHGVPCYRSS
jgi:hypothetical protein